jgi:hypothetical protein
MPMKLFEVRETHYCCFCREAILFGEEGVFIRGREHHATARVSVAPGVMRRQTVTRTELPSSTDA